MQRRRIHGTVAERPNQLRPLRKGRDDVRRHAVVCLAGYLLNLGTLSVFVDLMGLAHQFVQAVMVFVVAALTFGSQKVWVFRAPHRASQTPA